MSKFKAVKTSLDGLVIIEPTIFGDQRGFFFESYSERDFKEIGINDIFVQDNHSKSNKSVLRGLHFQSKNVQAKLIRVIRGAVLDVVVDLRPQSPTFGKWEKVLISAENKRQLFVPKQFAHGFLTLQDETEFLYKCTDYYAPDHDGGVLWSDPKIAIDWDFEKYGIKESELILSEKDKKQPTIDTINWEKLWQ